MTDIASSTFLLPSTHIFLVCSIRFCSLLSIFQFILFSTLTVLVHAFKISLLDYNEPLDWSAVHPSLSVQMAAFLEYTSNHTIVVLNYKAQVFIFVLNGLQNSSKSNHNLSRFIYCHYSQLSHAPIILNLLQFLAPLQISFLYILYLKNSSFLKS